MNFNFITGLFLLFSLALLAKAGPIEDYPNEVSSSEDKRTSNNINFCKKYENGRYFLNGEDYLCLVPYSGSIPKDVKELTEKHLIVLNEKFYDISSNMKYTFKKCNTDETESNSIDECYEEFAEIIGVADVEAIKPNLDLKEATHSILEAINDLCEEQEGKFFFNDNDYVCLVKPKNVFPQSTIISFFIDELISYHDEYYTPHETYTYINSVELYEYYTKIAELLDVNIDTLVPYQSFDDAINKYFEFKSKDCVFYYKKENSYACFGMSVVPDDEDLDSLLSNHYIVKDGKFYYLTNSSFQCKKGDPSCYDRIAYVMDVDVDSILPKENMETVIDIKKGCESESGLFYYISTGVDYVCLRPYEEETDIPENSVCFLDNKSNIYCVNGKYTEIEACKKDNEKFDYEICRETVENTVMSKTFSKYPSNSKPATIPSNVSSKIIFSTKQIPSPSPSSSFTPSSKTIPNPASTTKQVSETSICPDRDDGPTTSYYIFIEGGDETTDKQALLEIVNDRMNDIYNLIYKNSDKYKYYCNNDIDKELDATYPEGTKFLFVDELRQTTTSSDDYIPLKSSLIKVGNYLTRVEDGCSATASASSGCQTIYAYLTEDMVEEVKQLPNITKIEESNIYSFVSIVNDRARKTTPEPKYMYEPTLSKAIPVTTSAKQDLSFYTTKKVQEAVNTTLKFNSTSYKVLPPPITNPPKTIRVSTGVPTKTLPPLNSLKIIPVTTASKIQNTSYAKGDFFKLELTKTLPPFNSPKTIPSSSLKTIPVTTDSKIQYTLYTKSDFYKLERTKTFPSPPSFNTISSSSLKTIPTSSLKTFPKTQQTLNTKQTFGILPRPKSIVTSTTSTKTFPLNKQTLPTKQGFSLLPRPIVTSTISTKTIPLTKQILSTKQNFKVLTSTTKVLPNSTIPTKKIPTGTTVNVYTNEIPSSTSKCFLTPITIKETVTLTVTL